MNPKGKKILVADDEARNIRLIEAMLMPLEVDLLFAKNGEEAVEKALEYLPDVILMDVMMPVMDGFEAAKKIKDNEKTNSIPVVMVTALREVDDRVKALESGADDFLSKPVDKSELRARLISLLKVKEYNDYMVNYQKKLESEVAERTNQLKMAFDKIKQSSLQTIYILSKAAEYKDEDTGAHIQRMSNYSAEIVRHMGYNEDSIERVLYAASMHDVGKIGIPDKILLKPGKLDPQEWKVMKEHAGIGSDILSGGDSGFLKMAQIIANTHHEKWDGSGYPNGLKGKEIPLIGRIVAIADVFDALVSKRPYKEPFSVEKAISIIQEGKGAHFDPDVVDAFCAIKDKIVEIMKTYSDDEPSKFLSMVNHE